MRTLEGIEVVLSGTFPQSKEAIERQAMLSGAWVEKRVGEKTSYLVLGEKPSQAQVMKAKRQGVQAISYGAWMAMIRAVERTSVNDFEIPCQWISALEKGQNKVRF